MSAGASPRADSILEARPRRNSVIYDVSKESKALRRERRMGGFRLSWIINRVPHRNAGRNGMR